MRHLCIVVYPRWGALEDQWLALVKNLDQISAGPISVCVIVFYHFESGLTACKPDDTSAALVCRVDVTSQYGVGSSRDSAEVAGGCDGIV